MLAGERTSSEFSLSSPATIPLPGVGGRSSSSAAGDDGLLFKRMSGSLSTKRPVGVGGLRLFMFSGDSTVQSGLSISISRHGSTAIQINKEFSYIII